jgi:hypothetical protein
MAVSLIGDIDINAPRRCGESAVALALETYSEELLATMQDVAPKRSGALARGLQLRQIGRFEYIIDGTEEYTDAVRLGHRAFWVEPKAGGVLHWVTPQGDAFSKGHEIPATEPQRFDLRAQDIERARLPTYVGEAAAIVRRRSGC